MLSDSKQRIRPSEDLVPMLTKYQKLLKPDNEEDHFCSSYTDLLTTILICYIMTFIAIMITKSLPIEEIKKTIDQIMGVREKLVSELKSEFSEGADIEVDEKPGAIIFDTEI